MKTKSPYAPIIMLILAVIINAFLIILSFRHLLPLVIAVIFAIIIDTPVSFVEKKTGFSRGVVTIIFLTLLFCGLGYLLFVMAARFVFELARLINLLPMQREYFNSIFDKILQSIGKFSSSIPDEVITYLKANVDQILLMITNKISEYYSFLVDKIWLVPNLFINIFFVIIFVFLFTYFLTKDKNKIIESIKNLFPEQIQERVRSVQIEIILSFFRLIKAQIILVMISTIITIAGFYILKVDYALILGLICGLLDLVPIFGPSLIFIPWIIFSVIVNKIGFAVSLLILYIVVLGTRQVLQAKIIGQNLNVDPMLTLISIYFGIEFLGWIGLFIGPLVVVVVRALIHSGIIPPINKSAKKD